MVIKDVRLHLLVWTKVDENYTRLLALSRLDFDLDKLNMPNLVCITHLLIEPRAHLIALIDKEGRLSQIGDLDSLELKALMLEPEVLSFDCLCLEGLFLL